MDVRCGSCKKLFRVSDDKITGSGVKFKCTRCSEYVRIKAEDFEQYKALKAAAPLPEAKPVETQPMPEPQMPAAKGPAPLDLMGFEHHEPAGAEASSVAPPAPSSKLAFHAQSETKAEPVPASALTDTTHAGPAAPSPASRPSTVNKPATVPKPKKEIQDTVHPFASGTSAGAIGGLGCALPVLAVMLLGFGAAAKIVPALLKMPIYYLVAVSAVGLTALGIVIGIFLAMIQSGSEKKIFSFPGILLGGLLGMVIGTGYAAAVDMISGVGVNISHVVTGAASWGITALLVSIAVVIIRRTALSSRKESFSSSLSGLQIFGFILALLVVGSAVYGNVVLISKVRTAAEETVSTYFKDMTSTEGLQMVNTPSGYIDTNGDLVITGVVENTTDKEKPVWYLVAEVFDAQGKVLIQAKSLNGKQLYTPRDYDILSKRGVNVQDLKAKNIQERGAPLLPKGIVNFEIRIMEPPVGIATFNATLQRFDPLQMMKEAAEEVKQKQQ